MKKVFTISTRIILGLIAVLLLLILAIQTGPVQNYLIDKVTSHFSKQLQAHISIDHVDLSFFNKMDIEGVMIKDRNTDTLLHAGIVSVRITDWFFLRDKPSLEYIGLQDATIYLKRKDSVWNYQFLIDYFSTDAPADTTAQININLKKIDIKNLHFIQDDGWYGQKMKIKAGSILLNADSVDFNQPSFLVKSLDIDKPFFELTSYKGSKSTSDVSVKKTDPDSTHHLNPGQILAQIGLLTISNGSVVIKQSGVIPDKKHFEGNDIEISKINAKLSSVILNKDTVRANMTLSAKERSGLSIKKITAAMTVTPKIMEFDSLFLQTGKSTLTNYFAMRYQDFNADMADFVNKVQLTARLKNSTIHADDIAFFAPELDIIHQSLNVNGFMNGTVSNFTVKDLDIKDAGGSKISGDLSMKGLPDPKKTNIKLENAFLSTSNARLGKYFPALQKVVAPDLAALGDFTFSGMYEGSFSRLNATGNINTSLGSLVTKLKMEFPSGGEPEYSGSIHSQQFDLGRFLQVKGLGNVIFNGNIEGKGFALENLKTRLNGNFNSLSYNGYTYQNIKFNGDIQKQKINGELITEDPNFSLTSSIQVDLTGQEPKFNILGDLALARLRLLQLSKENFEFTGLFDLNFEGSDIDKFMGSAKILNASLLHNNERIEFDSLAVTAVPGLLPEEKILRIESNEFNILVQGRYNILGLPSTFQNFLHQYYPSYIQLPSKPAPLNQDFSFNIQTGHFEYYTNLLDTNLKGMNNASITGRVNNRDTSSFNFFLQVPFIQYKNYRLTDAFITGQGGIDSLRVAGDMGRMYVSDSLYFPNTHVRIKAAKDHSLLSLQTSANYTLNDAVLEAEVHTMPDGVRIDFQPSAFVLNDKKWELSKDGELLIKKSFAQATNMKFTQGFQEISIESDPNQIGNTSALIARIKDLNLADFMPLFFKKPELEGVVNGEVFLNDFYGKFKVETDLAARQFRMDNDSVGQVGIKGKYNSETGRVIFYVMSDNDKYIFSADGMYNTKDSTGTPLQTTLKLNGTSISMLNNLLGNIFTGIEGLGTGNITISGKPDAPQLAGSVRLKKAALTVNYTQVRYYIDSADILFTDRGIDFGKFTIKDSMGNTGSVQGQLFQRGFQNMRFNFLMSTPRLLLLDTKPKDNPLFYGRAIGSATLSLTGPLEDMYMNIKGAVTDSSHIFKPNSVSRESADADYIVFKQYGTEQVAPINNTSRLSIDMELTANNKAQIDVILDELTGDRIEARGNGTLKISLPAQGDMTMNGRYNIEGGKYNFSFQSIVKRPFILDPGSGSYINWSGNPSDADIRITARYVAKEVSIGTLTNSTGFSSSGTLRGAKENVDVVANLTGKLLRPDINLSFKFQENSALNQDENFMAFLRRIESDQNETLKQVTWLIVFNSFAPYQGVTNSTELITNTSVNTISQKLADVLDNAFSNVLNGLGLDVDLGTNFYSSNNLYGNSASSSTPDRQRVDLKVNKSLLDGKVIITFGGDIDINWGATSSLQNNKVQLLPDLSVQIILSKDRRLRAIIFNRSSFDVSGGALGRRNRQGVSISYSKDIDRLDYLFMPVNKSPSN